MVGEVCPAVDAAVCPVARGKVGLERLGSCHLHHGGHWTQRELRAAPRGAEAGGLARETLEHTGEGRDVAGKRCGRAPHVAGHQGGEGGEGTGLATRE